jgi:hypothetical protein
MEEYEKRYINCPDDENVERRNAVKSRLAELLEHRKMPNCPDFAQDLNKNLKNYVKFPQYR